MFASKSGTDRTFGLRDKDGMFYIDILMENKAAGNTGVRNELVSLCDELLRQNLIDIHKYKIIMLPLYNANNKKNLQKEIRYRRSWHHRFHCDFLARMYSSNTKKQLASTALQA